MKIELAVLLFSFIAVQSWRHEPFSLICVALRLCVLLLVPQISLRPLINGVFCGPPSIYFIAIEPLTFLGPCWISGESWDVASEGGGQSGEGWPDENPSSLSPLWNIAQVQNTNLHRDATPPPGSPRSPRPGLCVGVCLRVDVMLSAAVSHRKPVLWAYVMPPWVNVSLNLFPATILLMLPLDILHLTLGRKAAPWPETDPSVLIPPLCLLLIILLILSFLCTIFALFPLVYFCLSLLHWGLFSPYLPPGTRMLIFKSLKCNSFLYFHAFFSFSLLCSLSILLQLW